MKIGKFEKFSGEGQLASHWEGIPLPQAPPHRKLGTSILVPLARRSSSAYGASQLI